MAPEANFDSESAVENLLGEPPVDETLGVAVGLSCGVMYGLIESLLPVAIVAGAIIYDINYFKLTCMLTKSMF